MPANGLVRRSVAFTGGLFIMAFGVALSIKANLGTSPISSVPFVYSRTIPLTMGAMTMAMHVVLVLLQIAMLRKDYNPVQLLQLPIALIFGFFTDFTLDLVSANAPVHDYTLKWLLCLASALIIAFGVFLEVKARLIYLAGEGFILAFSKVFNVEFGKAKVGFDCTLVTIAVAGSFLFLHRLQGVREGTLASAVLVGTFVRLFSSKLSFVDELLGAPSSKK